MYSGVLKLLHLKQLPAMFGNNADESDDTESNSKVVGQTTKIMIDSLYLSVGVSL